MREFTNSIGLKIIYSGIAVFMIGFSIFLFNMPRGVHVSQWVILIPISIVLFALLILINQVKRKIIISAESIIKISAFGKKELLIANVRGCRIGQKVIYIEPKPATGKKIIINNYQDLSGSEELVKWLQENFIDLDSIDLKKNQQEVLSDSTIGITADERKEAIKKAKVIAILYSIGGMVIGFSIVFIDNNYVSLVLAVGCQLLGVLIMTFSKGLIKFVSDSSKSIYPFVFLGFPLPSVVILINSLDQFDLLSTGNLWLPAIAISLAMTAILYFSGVNSALKSILGQVITMFVVSLLFGFGSTIALNCVLDSSVLTVYKASVVDHRAVHGKGSEYFLTLSPWGPGNGPEELTVAKTVYDQTPIGGTVSVHVKKGLLNIPWYTVSD